ncbi:MAG TPA: hypothetical protein VFH48_07525 [Chloroflexota bacterium]|nr:hypothetical protein [Chloroflexota bacterium]
MAKFAGFGGGGSAVATSTPAPTPTLSPTPVPTAPRLLFGLGPEADGALASSLRQSAPFKMLTSWYSSPNDLSWMSGWRNNLVPQTYANGYTLHLVVFTNDPEVSLSTAYGPACGRSYPLSSRFVGDMAQLAQTFAGSGPLYVTLFTEFQTYPCADNTWVGSENYYRALKDQYLAALAAFRQHAPNAKVSIGWGGWQARWDNPAQGSGRSLFPRFADVMDASDFQSFQAMQSDTNVQDVRDMTSILGAYGPVMLAHYKPDNGSCPAATADLTTMLTDAYLRDVIEDGLFAWSFMDDGIVTCSSQLLTFVRSAVTTYAR